MRAVVCKAKYLLVAGCVIGSLFPDLGQAGVWHAPLQLQNSENRHQTEDTSTRRFELVRPAMGVELRIVVCCNDKAKAIAGLQAAAARVEALEQTLSNYRADSEAMQVGRALADGSATAGSDLFQLLERSRLMWVLSDGAFDVTIGPLADLWREARKSGHVPSDQAIKKALSQSGFARLKLEPQMRAVESDGTSIGFDFGGIGKGYAADAALKVLQERDLPSALVELGGDLAVGAAPPGESGWRVAVSVDGRTDKSTSYVVVANCGVATSGDTHQFVEIDGRRYSHLIDPRTGMGITRSGIVTVIAKDGTDADALASVFTLLSEERVQAIADSRDDVEYRGEIVSSDGERLELSSPGFPELMKVD